VTPPPPPNNSHCDAKQPINRQCRMCPTGLQSQMLHHVGAWSRPHAFARPRLRLMMHENLRVLLHEYASWLNSGRPVCLRSGSSSRLHRTAVTVPPVVPVKIQSYRRRGSLFTGTLHYFTERSCCYYTSCPCWRARRRHKGSVRKQPASQSQQPDED